MYQWLPALKAEGLLPNATKLHPSKFLNDLIEQGHRNVKQRIRAMLGFEASGCSRHNCRYRADAPRPRKA